MDDGHDDRDEDVVAVIAAKTFECNSEPEPYLREPHVGAPLRRGPGISC